MQTLGVGSSAKVVQVLEPDSSGDDSKDRIFAMKIISRQKLMNQGSVSASVAEFEILKRLSHPNIVKLIEIIDDPVQAKLYLVMEFYSGGNL